MIKNILTAAALAAGLLLATPPATAAPATALDPTASTYISLSPVRVLDTRNGAGTPVGAGGTVTVDLASRVPATATAVVLNVTGVTPTASTFVTVYPSGTTRPTASSLNLPPGDIRPNQVTVQLGANRAVSLYNHAGNTHLVADLAGYYTTGNGAKFTVLTPDRLLDTREAGGPVGPGENRVLDLSEQIPASATAVTFNLIATGPTASTFVTAWPTGGNRPTASNLNVPAGDTRANLVTVAVGGNRQVSLYNLAGSVDLVADVTGFYTPDFGSVFVPRNPERVLDTRTGTATPVGPGETIMLDLAGTVSLTTTGVVLNVTAVEPTAATHVAVWTDSVALWAELSTLNVSAGQIVPNATAVMLGDSLGLQLYNHAGSVHLVADLAGQFVAPEVACAADCVYAWGLNGFRKLGTAEARLTVPSPTPLPLSGVRSIAGSGGNGYALRTDGTVWAWGDNSAGQLGGGWRFDGIWGDSPVPSPVLGLTGVTAIASGGASAYALLPDGSVWAWGDNRVGQLGNGTTAGASVAVQVTGLTDVIAIAGGRQNGYAIRAGGTVWAWGDNRFGQLGLGSTEPYSAVPVQTSALTGFTSVADGTDGAVMALNADGTVWTWGDNTTGQLGNGQPCPPLQACVTPTPTQVADLTGVTAIAGGANTGYAVRDDGTVWAWGWAYRGRLGNGQDCVSCYARMPVQVSNLVGATQVASFDEGGYALLADGSVHAWGHNYYDSLGNTSAPDHAAVPVRVTGLSGVETLDGTWGSGYALRPSP